MKKINYSKQSINNSDIKQVVKILKSSFLTKGHYTLKFEEKIKNFCKSKYAVATINASAALIMACKALGVKKNDYVWTSNVTYVASINCALHLGAKIDFLEIDKNTFNICTDFLEDKLKIAKKKKKLPKAIVLVHLGGFPCNLKKIYQLSKKYNFNIIEDASHALGSTYKNSRIGSCRYSDLTVFSFHPVKNITTAEGGAITTNKINLYKKILVIRENGYSTNGISQKIYPTKYDIVELGYNFRINEINSALGISQIKRITKFINKKKIQSKRYFKELKMDEIILPDKLILKYSALHLFIIKIKFNLLKINKFDFINILKKKNIFVNTHYIPLSNFTLIKKYLRKKFIVSENYYQNAISIPLYPDMTYKEQSLIINLIKKTILFNKKKEK